jgi:xanthine dehydrogenase YagR molybdenum-binding subunit
MAERAPEHPPRFVTTTVEVEGRTEERVVEVPAFEPEPWGADAELTHVGARAVRVDALGKAGGHGPYTTDVRRAHQAYAAIVRAQVPRGRVLRIDTTAARAIPGVLDVLLHADVPTRTRLFAADVTYVGQPIAAVCAESADAAERGARAVVVEIEPLPHAVTVADATASDAAPVRPGLQSNLLFKEPRVHARGDAAAALATADVTITREVHTPCVLHSALEPHSAVAEWEGDRLTVWESTQGIYRVRDNLAKALGIPLTDVRVICEAMGGGFGAKNYAAAHTYIAALFARRLGRAVACFVDRAGEQTDTGNRPLSLQRVTLGATRDGRLTAIDVVAEIPLGIGGWEGGPGEIYHELYACPNVRTHETFAFVNTAAMAAFRAPGHAEGAVGLEIAMNALARELDMDPLALRRVNFAERDQKKDRPYTGNRLLECYDEGARRFDWHAPRDRSSHLKRGVGVAAQVWSTGGGPPSYATVRLNTDGTADVLAGSQDLGTGTRTILAQVAAEALGHDLTKVRAVIGDTASGPYSGNSWGSMTVASLTPAVRMAAEDAKGALLDAAAGLLGASVGSLEARDGRVRVKGPRTAATSDAAIAAAIDAATERSMTFAEIAAKLGNVMIQGHGSRGPNTPDAGIVTTGAQFAEVEVDTETGVVRVLRVVAVHDAGRIVNPTLAESQLEGGIIQGLGFALFEERALDATLGWPLNVGLHDYKLPTMADIPEIDGHFLAGADPAANHVGARGIAEPAIIPTAPAIAGAVADALGVDVTELPLTPWRVLQALGRVAVALVLLLAPMRVILAQGADAGALADRVFARYSAAVPGCVVGVAQGGRVVLERAYGSADLERNVALTPASILEAGSVAKQFTAAAVTLLALEGKLRFDDPVQQHLPEIPQYERPVTIRMLLDHTSGLRDWGDIASLGGWPRGTRAYEQAHVLEIISRQRALNYQPGDAYSYTNSGYNLLAMLVARVSGQSFAEFTRERLFVPLRMPHTSWRDDYRRIVSGRALAYRPVPATSGWRIDMPIENAHGNGGLLTTVRDLLTWNEALTQRTVGGAHGRALVDSLTRQAVLTSGERIPYAAGLVVNAYRGTPQIGHSGSTAGYRAYLARYPSQQDLSVAVLCNTSANATMLAHGMVDGLATGLAPVTRGPDRRPQPITPQLPIDTLQRYAGEYESAEVGVRVRISVERGALVMHRAPADSWRLTTTADGRLAAGGVRIWFTRDAGDQRPLLHAGTGRAHDVVFSAMR